MSSHTIVYLDQNYVSYMAKAGIGRLKDEDDSKFWQLLFRDLKAAVLGNRIACPKSGFHRKETRLAGGIKEATEGVINELSCGLELNPWEVILQLQIEDAAFGFLGKSPPPRDAWSIAFNSDPLAPVESRTEHLSAAEGRMSVSDLIPDEVIERDRNLKRDFVVEGNERLNKYRTNPLEWSKLLLDSKKNVVDGFMGKPARQSIAHQEQSGSLLNRLTGLARRKQLEDLWNRLYCIGIDTNDRKMIRKFAESEEFLNSPFLEIYGSILAVIGEHRIQGRELGEGDNYDAGILASAVPYYDVIATERFMKAILTDSRLRFDRKYKCTIFSAGKTDPRAFHELINELI